MVTHEDIRTELLRRLAAHELTGKAVSLLLGVAPARITEIKAGKRRIQPEEMAVLVRFLGLDKGNAAQDASNIVEIPVIGAASAGAWREAVTFPKYTVRLARRSDCHPAFAVEVAGDSMDRVMAEGSWAVIDPEQTRLYDGRVYLIANHEFEATIKRYRSNPARFEPDSHNPEHRPIFMDEHRIQVIGRVVSYGGDAGL